MYCPRCQSSLNISQRQGVEIDTCPACRGVWLDRGELDKIIERSATTTAPPPVAPEPRHHREHYRDHDDRRHHYPKRRKSFLEELFD